jgi:hypothetical protein
MKSVKIIVAIFLVLAVMAGGAHAEEAKVGLAGAKKIVRGINKTAMSADWQHGVIVVNPAEWARLTYRDKQLFLVSAGEARLRLYGKDIIEVRCGYTNRQLGFYTHDCPPQIY